jgi:threonine dehydratase
MNTINAFKNINKIMKITPLQFNIDLSFKYNNNIYLKREDLTPVKSYKIRGAYNKMSSIINNNIVTCSAGNHAQGVAYSCNKLNIKGDIFMSLITTQQKIDKVKKFGGNMIKIHLVGNNFDEAYEQAINYSKLNNLEFVHPFNDLKVIEGQSTIGYEILLQNKNIDYILAPIGGGGLCAGLCKYIKNVNPKIKIIGIEPLNAAGMNESIKAGKVITLDKIDTFVDGAAVKQVGNLNFDICNKYLDDIILIDEGHVCTKIIEMYNNHSLIIEPAGVLSLCALDCLNIKNKNIACIISGGNSDIFRMNEIMERSLLYQELKHYFQIELKQKPGALKEYILKILGDNNIIYFKYKRIINKETGPIIIGIETKNKKDIIDIINNMKLYNITFTKLNYSDISI